jgi:hypothetical protein
MGIPTLRRTADYAVSRTNVQAALNSTSPASPESQSFSNLNPVFALNSLSSQKEARHGDHLPEIDQFLQRPFLAVEGVHHVHVLLVKTDATHSIISEKWLGSLFSLAISDPSVLRAPKFRF